MVQRRKYHEVSETVIHTDKDMLVQNGHASEKQF